MARPSRSPAVPVIEEHFSPVQLAGRLGVCARTIGRALAAGHFPRAVFLGRRWLIPAGDVERWLAGLRPHRPPSAPHAG
jgi:excisionase family DNA binding protein